MIEFGNYGLGSDAQSWIIYAKKVNKKDGRVRWVATGYYFHLDDALRGLSEDYLRTPHADVKSLLDAVAALSRQFQNVARGIRPRTANAA